MKYNTEMADAGNAVGLTTDKVTDKEFAEITRQMIRHEDSVLSQRLSYCVTIEGLLLASLGFAWEKAPPEFIYIVCFAGLFVSVSTFYASSFTVKAMSQLVRAWRIRSGNSAYDGPNVVGRDPDEWSAILRPSLAIPGIFFFVWVMIGYVRHTTP